MIKKTGTLKKAKKGDRILEMRIEELMEMVPEKKKKKKYIRRKHPVLLAHEREMRKKKRERRLERERRERGRKKLARIGLGRYLARRKMLMGEFAPFGRRVTEMLDWVDRVWEMG